ncbi:hypothetical protein ACPRNU_25360 [Chromobacterium vaccinii]|uniref:hypothetical protein n=1 Tax=Chromobacterium vaccinii TaxID=1108595 RepID=UPI003C76AC24
MEVTVSAWFDHVVAISFFMIPVNVLFFIVNKEAWSAVKENRSFSLLKLIFGGDWVRQLLKILLIPLFAVFFLAIYAEFFDNEIPSNQYTTYPFLFFLQLLALLVFDFLGVLQIVFCLYVVYLKKTDNAVGLDRVQAFLKKISFLLAKIFTRNPSNWQ